MMKFSGNETLTLQQRSFSTAAGLIRGLWNLHLESNPGVSIMTKVESWIQLENNIFLYFNELFDFCVL